MRNSVPVAQPITNPEATPGRPKRGKGPTPRPRAPPKPICRADTPSSVNEGICILPVPRTMEASVLSNHTKTAAAKATLA